MKMKWPYLGIIALLLESPALSYAQTGRLSIGLDYGTSIIQQGRWFEVRTGFSDDFSLEPTGSLIPKNLRGRLELNLGSTFLLRFSAGYGLAKNEAKSTQSLLLLDSGGSLQDHSETKSQVSGFPMEATMIWQIPLDQEERIGVHFGLGGGFYSYKFKTEGFFERSSSQYPADNRRLDLENPDLKISGLAQFFMAGISLRINSKVRATFELSKLGWSGLKAKHEQDIESFGGGMIKRYKGENAQDYNAGSGFNDVGLTLGVSMNLGR